MRDQIDNTKNNYKAVTLGGKHFGTILIFSIKIVSHRTYVRLTAVLQLWDRATLYSA